LYNTCRLINYKKALREVANTAHMQIFKGLQNLKFAKSIHNILTPAQALQDVIMPLIGRLYRALIWVETAEPGVSSNKCLNTAKYFFHNSCFICSCLMREDVLNFLIWANILFLIFVFCWDTQYHVPGVYNVLYSFYHLTNIKLKGTVRIISNICNIYFCRIIKPVKTNTTCSTIEYIGHILTYITLLWTTYKPLQHILI